MERIDRSRKPVLVAHFLLDQTYPIVKLRKDIPSPSIYSFHANDANSRQNVVSSTIRKYYVKNR